MGIFKKTVRIQHGIMDSPSAIEEKSVYRPWVQVAVPAAILVGGFAAEEALLKKPLVGIFKEKAPLEEKIKREYQTINSATIKYRQGNFAYAALQDGTSQLLAFYTDISKSPTRSSLEGKVVNIIGASKDKFFIPKEIKGTEKKTKGAIYQTTAEPSDYPIDNLVQMPTKEELEKGGYDKIVGTFSSDYTTINTEKGEPLKDKKGKPIKLEPINERISDMLKLLAQVYTDKDGKIEIYYGPSSKKGEYLVKGILPIK